MPNVSRRDTVPGPRGSLLLGMTVPLQRDALGTFESAMLSYGDVVRLVAGPPGLRLPLYLVSHPDGVRRVLAENAAGYAKKGPIFREMEAYFGNGLVLSDGQQWRQQRRVVAPLFTRRRTSGYAQDMIREAVELADRWAGAKHVDLHTEMTDYAMGVVGQTLFGSSFAAAKPVLRRTFPLISQHAVRRGLNPLRLPRTWPTPAGRRAARAQRELFTMVDQMIHERRRGTPGDDLVSLLLAARDPETGAALTEREVRDQALIFLLAGHETAATALTFTGYLLATHPEAQHRVCQEIDAVLGGAVPTVDDLSKLTYTTMVIKEAMRLYPSVHSTTRVAIADDVIGEHVIRAGSVVVISPWLIQHHPDFWPDPYRFDPDRFRPEAESGRHRYAYLPFGGGPRICIGAHFAMVEVVAAVAVLLSAYTLSAGSTPPPLQVDATLRPAVEVSVEISQRRRRAAA